LHHIPVYADTEILSARLLIILSMARWISSTRLPIPFCRTHIDDFLLKMTKFDHIIFYLKKNIDDVYIFYWK
jgi:hypothetical protein